ncbi:MAG: DUF4912 domain-containing protein [bacterium]
MPGSTVLRRRGRGRSAPPGSAAARGSRHGATLLSGESPEALVNNTRMLSSARPIGAPSPADATAGELGARIVGLARDPAVIYVYWDISTEALAAARARLGHGALASRLVLRTHEVTGTEAAEAAYAVLEFDVSDADRDAFVRVSKPGTRQIVEIGLVGDDGSFVAVARSGTVAMPRSVPATWEPPDAARLRFRTIEPPAAAPEPAQPASPGERAAAVADAATIAAPSTTDLAAASPSVLAPPPEALVDLARQATSTSPLGGWSKSAGAPPGVPGLGASEAWAPFAARPTPVMARAAGSADRVEAADAHVRTPVGIATERAIPRATASWPPAEPPSSAPRAPHAPSAADPGRQAGTLEPASASVDVHGDQPTAAEGVWSSAEVSENVAPKPVSTALEKRQLPVPAPSESTALVPASAAPPGWDQLVGGLGSLGRGLVQAAGGVLRVTTGIAKLGGWAVRKALEALRDKKR